MPESSVILKSDLQRLARKIDTLAIGVDAIDKRIIEIEIEKLPKHVKALELRR